MWAERTPTVERYLLTDASGSSKIPKLLAFFFDADGSPIGGYNRNYVGALTTESSTATRLGLEECYKPFNSNSRPARVWHAIRENHEPTQPQLAPKCRLN